MNLKEYTDSRMLAYTGGMERTSPSEENRLTLISDAEAVRQKKHQEYRIHWGGDSDELLNFYSKYSLIDSNQEPIYGRNKRSCFWCVSSTEEDIERVCAGIARDIQTTMAGLIGKPASYGVGPTPKSSVLKTRTAEKKDDLDLDGILEECGFWSIYSNEQVPLTLVDGYGCYKVSWDLAVSDRPYVSYYDWESVIFASRAGKIAAVMFLDWYKYEEKTSRKFLVTEFRCIRSRRDEEGLLHRDLIIEKRVWKTSGDSDERSVTMCSKDEAPNLFDEHMDMEIPDFDSLLATPCVFYGSQKEGEPGKSIFTGKIDQFDAIDQTMSQLVNAIRKSGLIEYFNTDFLDRDKDTQMPRMPHIFDRKYVSYAGGRDANGGMTSSEPVQVTQPKLDVGQYISSLNSQIGYAISGILSPATMGIGVAAAATQESQREKEKITIATRGHLIDRETAMLKSLFSDLLCADEYLRTGEITTRKYDISIKFGEFADNTFEQKSSVLVQALGSGAMSPEMYLDKLYGDSLSDEDYDHELEFLKQAAEKPEEEDEDVPGLQELVG